MITTLDVLNQSIYVSTISTEAKSVFMTELRMTQLKGYDFVLESELCLPPPQPGSYIERKYAPSFASPLPRNLL